MSFHPQRGRRELLRVASAAALAVLASGARVVFDASPAGAQEDLDVGCCVLALRPSQWCPFMCRESGKVLRCWTCSSSCKCCECTASGPDVESSCFTGTSFACSYKSGCC